MFRLVELIESSSNQSFVNHKFLSLLQILVSLMHGVVFLSKVVVSIALHGSIAVTLDLQRYFGLWSAREIFRHRCMSSKVIFNSLKGFVRS